MKQIKGTLSLSPGSKERHFGLEILKITRKVESDLVATLDLCSALNNNCYRCKDKKECFRLYMREQDD